MSGNSSKFTLSGIAKTHHEKRFPQNFVDGCTLVLIFILGIACLRVEVASFLSKAEPLPLSILLLGWIYSAARFPRVTLLAVLAFSPLLNGLSQSGYLVTPNACLVSLCATIIGFLSSSSQRKKLFRSNQNVDRLLGGGVITFFTAIFFATCYRLIKEPATSTISLFKTVDFGYGDSMFLVTAGTLWIVGVGYFFLLASTLQAFLPTKKEILLVFGAYTAIAFPFIILQGIFNIPGRSGAATAFSSPMEDINSFGAISGACFCFWLSLLTSKRASQWAYANATLTFIYVILSWSRSTWVSTVIISLYTGIRRSVRVTSIFVLLTGCIFASFYFRPANQHWFLKDYETRLESLIRIENPLNKSRDRVFLYEKAFRMVKEQPFWGHGIGSFYIKSTLYASPSDPYSKTPDFAHNIFLQVAVELGLPVTAVLIMSIVLILKSAFHFSYKNTNDADDRKLYVAALSLAVSSYILTELTANSLNVYVTNQIFFWGILAICYALQRQPVLAIKQ